MILPENEICLEYFYIAPSSQHQFEIPISDLHNEDQEIAEIQSTPYGSQTERPYNSQSPIVQTNVRIKKYIDKYRNTNTYIYILDCVHNTDAISKKYSRRK